VSSTYTIDDIRERAREVRKKIMKAMIDLPGRLLKNLTPLSGSGIIETGAGAYDAPVTPDITMPPMEALIRDADTGYEIRDLPVRKDTIPSLRWNPDEHAESWVYQLSRLVNLHGLMIGVKAGEQSASVKLDFLYNLTINYLVFEDEVVGFIHPKDYPPVYREESDEEGNVYHILDVPAVGQAFMAQLGGVTVFVLAYAKICYRTQNGEFVCAPGFVLHVNNCSNTDLEIMLYGKRIKAPSMTYTRYIDTSMFSIHAEGNVPEGAECELELPLPPSDEENEPVDDEPEEPETVPDNPTQCLSYGIEPSEDTETVFVQNNCGKPVKVAFYGCIDEDTWLSLNQPIVRTFELPLGDDAVLVDTLNPGDIVEKRLTGPCGYTECDTEYCVCPLCAAYVEESAQVVYYWYCVPVYYGPGLIPCPPPEEGA